MGTTKKRETGMGDFGRRALGVAAALAALAIATVAQAQDGIRMVEGSLAYREQLALPPETLAVIEARDGRGRLIGEATLRTRGAQVPLPFRIALPEGFDAKIRAALVAGGRPIWYADGIAIPASSEPVSLGEIILERYVPTGFSSTLRCGDRMLRVGYFGAIAVMEADGVRLVLESVAAASGARFELPGNPGTWLWSRGNAVIVSVEGQTLPECSVVPPEAPAPYRAQGNEPGWSLVIDAGRIELITDTGARRLEAVLPDARFEDGAFVYIVPSLPLEIRLSAVLCRDDMTGMPYPDTVGVTLDGQRFTGCGGAPTDLLSGGEWVVEDIGGRGIIDSSRVTLTFSADGGLGGAASCNRYATSVTIGAEGVTVGAIAATKMACPDALMNQERAFFATLASVVRFDFDETGALLLYGGDSPDPVLKARR
jgi:heat shock protein HslJ